MTIISSKAYGCRICRKKSLFRIPTGTGARGSCGPDTRPSEMERSTLKYRIQECPTCGYVSFRISDRPGLTKVFHKSDRYLTYDGLQIESAPARKYYRQYMICMRKKDYPNAFMASLRAAWASDAEQDNESSVFFRNRCIDLFDLAKPDMDTGSKAVFKSDLFRRAGRFKEAVDACHGIEPDREFIRKLLAFEESLAVRKDKRAYTVDEAEKAGLLPV